MGNAVFVYGVREIVWGVLLLFALGCFAYGYIDYQWKEWRKRRALRSSQEGDK